MKKKKCILKVSVQTYISPVFVIRKECIRYPYLLGKVSAQGQYFFICTKRQPLILPILVQIHSNGVVLLTNRRYLKLYTETYIIL